MAGRLSVVLGLTSTKQSVKCLPQGQNAVLEDQKSILLLKNRAPH